MEDATTIHFLQESSPFCCFVSIQAHSWEAPLSSYWSVKYGEKSQVKNWFSLKKQTESNFQAHPWPMCRPLLASSTMAKSCHWGLRESKKLKETRGFTQCFHSARMEEIQARTVSAVLASGSQPPRLPNNTFYWESLLVLEQQRMLKHTPVVTRMTLLLHMAKEQLPLSKPAGIRLTGLSGGFGWYNHTFGRFNKVLLCSIAL